MVNNVVLQKIKAKFIQAQIVKRTLSTIVLMPLCIWIIFLEDKLYFKILSAVIGGLILFEWFYIVYQSDSTVIARKKKAFWYSLGAVYAIMSCFSLILMHSIIEPVRFFLLCLIVWSNDIFGYFTGIIIGGKKLCPKISPSKTWSGFFGGIIAAVIVGTIYNNQMHINNITGFSTLMIIMLSIVSQGGDLAESAFKRRFKVKDSGRIVLIPGHGGVMDRVDGLVAVCIISVCAMFILSFLYDVVQFVLGR